MDNELQNRLIEFLDKALNGTDASVDFMSSQLPDYVEQLLTWYVVKGFLSSLFFITAAFFIVKYIVKSSKIKESWFYDSCGMSIPAVFGILFTACFVLFAAVASYANIMQSIQILIAPKVWLVEYISRLAG